MRKSLRPQTATALFGMLAFIGALAIAGAQKAPSTTAESLATDIPQFGSDGGPESVDGDPDQGAFGMPAMLRDDEPETDPALFEKPGDLLPERYLQRSVSWRAPDYSSQAKALGWSADVFKTPPGLVKRVEFWKSIYAKYTTDQGVLHDIDDVAIVYEAVDFTLLMKDRRKSLSAKARMRTKLVKARRAEISKRLERLSKMKSEKDVRDAADRKLLALFTKENPATFFQNPKKRELENLRKRLKSSAKKRKIRFQLGQKDKFILGIYYSGRYLRAMEKIFRDERLPIELTRLPFVESSFNIQARSRVGASGIWQFMPRTARPWMMVNRDVDERNDPLTATQASARLMRANFERLRTWPLALTAYNHGATGVARAVRKTNTRDLATIIDNYEGRRFGFASSNFYACFLAALETEKNARAHLGDVKWSSEFDGIEIDLKKPLSWRAVVDIYNRESALAELQNPHLNQRVRTHGRSIPKGTFVRVPATRADLARSFIDGQISEADLKRRLAAIPSP